MPVWLQDLTWVNPIRHFTDITKQIYLKDASFDIIWHSLWPLLVITATTGSAAYALFRRKIKKGSACHMQSLVSSCGFRYRLKGHGFSDGCRRYAATSGTG